MDDLISRQAALDAVNRAVTQEAARWSLQELPSAQPEKSTEKRTETHACDLISRQAAIDALKEHRALFCDNTPDTFSKLSYGEKSRVDELDNAIATLVNLPSAQPGREKGRWVHDGYDFPGGVDWIHCSECGKRGINVPADLSNFCPSCGADMRQEEQEE